MNGQNYGEWLDSSEIVERTDEETNNTEENAEHFVYEEQGEGVLIHDKPVGGIVPAASPVDAPVEPAAPLEPAPYPEPTPHPQAFAEPVSQDAPGLGSNGSSKALFTREQSDHYRTRWNEIQATFVDEPCDAVQQADGLVAEMIMQITHKLADEHGALKSQWNSDKDVSTEDLRLTLQHYRAFFNRMVM